MVIRVVMWELFANFAREFLIVYFRARIFVRRIVIVLMNKGIFALSMGTFALGITEFLMMGILVNLANDLSVSVTQAEHLISA